MILKGKCNIKANAMCMNFVILVYRIINIDELYNKIL